MRASKGGGLLLWHETDFDLHPVSVYSDGTRQRQIDGVSIV